MRNRDMEIITYMTIFLFRRLHARIPLINLHPGGLHRSGLLQTGGEAPKHKSTSIERVN